MSGFLHRLARRATGKAPPAVRPRTRTLYEPSGFARSDRLEPLSSPQAEAPDPPGSTPSPRTTPLPPERSLPPTDNPLMPPAFRITPRPRQSAAPPRVSRETPAPPSPEPLSDRASVPPAPAPPVEPPPEAARRADNSDGSSPAEAVHRSAPPPDAAPLGEAAMPVPATVARVRRPADPLRADPPKVPPERTAPARHPALPPASPTNPESIETAPTIRISIGRVELRAEFKAPPAPVAPPKRAPRLGPHLSLEDYMRNRSGGGAR